MSPAHLCQMVAQLRQMTGSEHELSLHICANWKRGPPTARQPPNRFRRTERRPATPRQKTPSTSTSTKTQLVTPPANRPRPCPTCRQNTGLNLLTAKLGRCLVTWARRGMKPAEVYQRLRRTLQQDAVLNTRCSTRIPVDRIRKFQTATQPASAVKQQRRVPRDRTPTKSLS